MGDLGSMYGVRSRWCTGKLTWSFTLDLVYVPHRNRLNCMHSTCGFCRIENFLVDR